MKVDLKYDNYKAAMSTWNTLSLLIDSSDKIYTDVEDFKSFYNVVLTKILEEKQID